MLWRRSAECFNSIVPSALEALAGDPALLALAETLEVFFLGEKQQRPVENTTNKAGLPVVPLLEISKPGTGTGTGIGTGITRRSSPTGALEDQEVGVEDGRRPDVDLELAVLDTLTDVVLQQDLDVGDKGIHSSATLCKERDALVKRLVSIVDRCIVRPPAVATHSEISHFSHVCIRKMYVLCSRVNGSRKVAIVALPLFLTRAASLLRAFTGEGRDPDVDSGGNLAVSSKPRVDEIMCLLEVVASMTLVPEVVDESGILGADGDSGPGAESKAGSAHILATVVKALRNRPEVVARGRERTHLLLLYPALVGCIMCKEGRVREMVRDVLALAGAELGLSIGSFGV